MKLKINLILSGFVIFTLGLSLKAQDTNSSQGAILAEEFLSLMNIQQNLNVAFQQMTKMQQQMAGLPSATPENQEMQQKLTEAIQAETKALMSWEAIKPKFIAIYSETFTPDELKGLIAFYKTPVGKKLIEKQPQLQMATMQKMQSIIVELQPKLQEAIKRVVEAQKKAQ